VFILSVLSTDRGTDQAVISLVGLATPGPRSRLNINKYFTVLRDHTCNIRSDSVNKLPQETKKDTKDAKDAINRSLRCSKSIVVGRHFANVNIIRRGTQTRQFSEYQQACWGVDGARETNLSVGDGLWLYCLLRICCILYACMYV
jgi:hypothetical protein